MLLPISALEYDKNRAACYAAQQHLLRAGGEQALVDLELPNPMDDEIDLLEMLRGYGDALNACYADGSVCDPRAIPGGDIELDRLMTEIAAAIQDEEDQQAFLDSEAHYLDGLYYAFSRHCESAA